MGVAPRLEAGRVEECDAKAVIRAEKIPRGSAVEHKWVNVPARVE